MPSRLVRTAASHEIARALTGRNLRAGWRTRFAPAPTGHLHLGHVVNALHVWGVARAFGGQVLLRVEDHDRTRARRQFESALLDDLDWLGFSPDIGSTNAFRAGSHHQRQSDNSDAYSLALQSFELSDQAYGCVCTRKEIAEISGDVFGRESPYPGTCARRPQSEVAFAVARRFRVIGEAETFDDIRLGAQEQLPMAQCGDFLLRDRNGNFTYQFAVTVDDFHQQIDLIIRGEDLLSSTGRQLQLARRLGRGEAPQFLHHQLLMRPDGLKLSKSLGDTGVREMRAAGLTREQVLGRAAFACGLILHDAPLRIDDVAHLFD